jgi:Fungal chitosanase of glycosyl hydrolase group 75
MLADELISHGQAMKRIWTASVLSACAIVAQAEVCDDVASRLGRLDLTRAIEIQATAHQTFTQLYKECDEKDSFGGAALPTFKGKSQKCSTDLNRVEQALQFSDKTVLVTAKGSVDADGSPAACGPHRSLTDQCETWLTFDPSSAKHFVDAEQVPFVVVPGSFHIKRISFMKATGIGKGDLAVAFYAGRCAFGVVGDSGPYFRLGELSVAAHEELGNPQCATFDKPCTRLKGNGSGRGIESGVTYVIFPKSRPKPLTADDVVVVANANAKKALESFLSANAPH